MSELIRPKTIEGLIESIELLHSYYGENEIPYQDSICPTHSLFLDMAKRIVELEKKLKDKDA